MVDGRTLDDRPYTIAVPLGVGQPLQHDDPTPFTSNIAVGGGIESLALPFGGQHHSFCAKLVYAPVQNCLNPGGDCEVCLPLLQVCHRIIHGNQRRRTGSIDRLRRAHQPEDEGDAPGRAIQVGATEGVQTSSGFSRSAGVKNQHPVLVIAYPGVHAGEAALQLERVDSRIFKRFPACFQHHALLWVQQFRLDGRDAEERGVELIDVVHESAIAASIDLHRRIADDICQPSHARSGDSLSYRVPALFQQLPEGVQVLSAGETTCHANYRYRLSVR